MPVDPFLQQLLDAPLRGDCGTGRPRAKKGGRGRANGYFRTPGGGPEGETCGTCGNRVSVQGGARRFPKCALAKYRWTRGGASDIRLASPSCSSWVAR